MAQWDEREGGKSGPSRGPEWRVESKGSLTFYQVRVRNRELQDRSPSKAMTVTGRKGTVKQTKKKEDKHIVHW
jgi:hypothetical protein